jgi:hypothetical protein
MDIQISNYEDYKEITEAGEKKQFIEMAKEAEHYLKLSILLGKFPGALAQIIELAYRKGELDQMKKIQEDMKEAV